MGPNGPRVAIVGGSLGGLNAALRLRDAGADVHVFERSPRPLEARGAGIVLHPATTGYLERRGLLDLDRVSSSATTLRYLRRDGSVLLEEPIAYRFTSYATLYAALVPLLEADRYHLGAECVALEPDGEGVTVRFADGTGRRVDLVVGADGVHSTVRALLFPGLAPGYAGYVAWRGTLVEASVPPPAAAALEGTLCYFVGDRSHMLSYEIPAVGGGRHLNWVWYRNVPDGADLDGLLTARDGARRNLSLAPGEVRERFVDDLHRAAPRCLPGPFAAVVRASATPFVQVVVDIEVPSMVVGRVCLIGDAAFTLRPHIAAGTAKAALDAETLAEAIRSGPGNLDVALATWGARQLDVGRRAAARTRQVGERAQLTGTFRPGDPEVAFGLLEPKDGNFPGLGAASPPSS